MQDVSSSQGRYRVAREGGEVYSRLGLIALVLFSSLLFVPKIGLTADQPDAVANGICMRALNMLYEQTDAHFHKGEYNHIINLCRIDVQGDPHNLEAYANSSWLLWSMDRDKEAVEFLLQGLKANPNTYYMYDELGSYYYFRRKDYAKSISYYEQASACKDCPALTLHMLAHAYQKNGQLQEAKSTWERVLAMKNDPNHDIAKHNLQEVEQLLAKQNRVN